MEWVPYEGKPLKTLTNGAKPIESFIDTDAPVYDVKTVESFGDEWEKFSQFSAEEIAHIGNEYFDIINSTNCPPDAVVMDLGCGSGRWSRYLAPKVKCIEGVDPSQAVYTAAALNKDLPNFRVTQASVEQIPFPPDAFDFIFCLGVLHHVPQTAQALQKATVHLKPGGHFLIYLYYALDNRGWGYRTLFRMVDVMRRGISRLPKGLKHFVCDVFAVTVYLPLVLLSRVVTAIFGKKAGDKIPLSYYRDKTWRVIRNDALDRMGTPLEQRFSKAEITTMMEQAGLTNIVFSDRAPYWHAVGQKR